MRSLSSFTLLLIVLFIASGNEAMAANGPPPPYSPICEKPLYKGVCQKDKCNQDCIKQYGSKATGICFPNTCTCRYICQQA
ncbi:hypothetical protein ACOSQ2_020978 [Xanthoceras sorbifolium]